MVAYGRQPDAHFPWKGHGRLAAPETGGISRLERDEGLRAVNCVCLSRLAQTIFAPG